MGEPSRQKQDVSQYNVTVDTVAPRADPSSSSASAHALHANLERGLTMTRVPLTKKHVYGPRDSLEMSFVEDYIPPPPPGTDVLKRTSLGLAPGLGSELGASNDSAGTERTAASSTCASSDRKSLDRFGLTRPRISVGTASTSDRSLTIEFISCEEPAGDTDDVHVDDDDDDDGGVDNSDRSQHKRPSTSSIESIMKYKTHDESLKNSYVSSRRKHLKKQKQKKKKKRASIKRNRHSGTALARMGRRVGSLPNMKRALGSVVRLGSTANFDSDLPGKVTEVSSSASNLPKGGETNADWASPPVPAAAATEASTGNIFLDMLEKKEAKAMEIDKGGGVNSIPTTSCNDGAVSAVMVPSTSISTDPTCTAPATSSTKESTGNIFLDMLKHQEEQQWQQPGVDRATTTSLLGLPQNRAMNNSSNLVIKSNTTTAGTGLVFDPRLTKVRDVGNGGITPSETSNVSEGPLHSTDGPMEGEPRILDSSGIPSARPRRAGRRASYGDVSDLRKNVNFAVEELSHSKKSKKRLSFSSVSKAFNDSLASLLSNGSKSQGDGVDDDEEENDDENDNNSPALKFSTLEIREYDTQLDTNPGVSCGPAIALSWSYTVSARVTVEKYEELRPPRRRMKEMRVPASEREFRLRMSGVSRREIEESIKSIEKARKERRKAIQHMKNDTMHEKLEGARRKLLKLLGRKKSQKQKEEELWDNAQCYFAANTTGTSK